MPGFSYVAVDKKGKEKRGSIEADTREKVVDILKNDGLIPVSVKEQGALNKFFHRKESKAARSECILSPVCQHYPGGCADERSLADALRAD